MDLAWPQIWGTVAALATAVILLVSAAAAWVSVRSARQLRREQTRPWVVLDFDTPVSAIIVDLSIRNVGPTVARNVQFRFHPDLVSTYDDRRAPIREWTILKEGIQSLPPGREYRLFFDRGPDRLENELSNTYQVIITYEGPDGEAYSDSQTLDLSHLYGMEHITPKRIHDIAKELETIRKTLGKIEGHLRR